MSAESALGHDDQCHHIGSTASRLAAATPGISMGCRSAGWAEQFCPGPSHLLQPPNSLRSPPTISSCRAWCVAQKALFLVSGGPSGMPHIPKSGPVWKTRSELFVLSQRTSLAIGFLCPWRALHRKLKMCRYVGNYFQTKLVFYIALSRHFVL